MSRRNINASQFGILYHGTNAQGLTEIQQHLGGGPRYSAMRNSYGWNYATTGLQTAIDYARDAHQQDRTGVPTVYDVSPRNKSHAWGPDPDSGPGGWNDGPANKGEALDIHEGGGEVSLRFGGPLKVNREVFVEDKAKDITGSKIGVSDKTHWMGRSFT